MPRSCVDKPLGVSHQIHILTLSVGTVQSRGHKLFTRSCSSRSNILHLTMARWFTEYFFEHLSEASWPQTHDTTPAGGVAGPAQQMARLHSWVTPTLPPSANSAGSCLLNPGVEVLLQAPRSHVLSCALPRDRDFRGTDWAWASDVAIYT